MEKEGNDVRVRAMCNYMYLRFNDKAFIKI